MQNYLPIDRQNLLLEACREIARRAPFFTPQFHGKGFVSDFALRMTNAGRAGWLGDEKGFRYHARNKNGEEFPPIPIEIKRVARELAGKDFRCENCLINLYKAGHSHLGLHRDRAEENRTAPIISISLGATAVFQIGGLKRTDPLTNINLLSGDVVILGGGIGGARNAYHAVKTLIPNSTPDDLIIKPDTRINITIRQVY